MEKTPLPLTAAELFVLRDPNVAKGRDAFKLALTELIAKGIARFRREERKVMWVFTQHQDFLSVEMDARGLAQLEPDLRAAAEVVAYVSNEREGAQIAAVVQYARIKFGGDLDKFKTDVVLSTLVRNGYLYAQQEKTLGLFSHTRYELTDKGRAARENLDAWRNDAQDLSEMYRRNPAEAIALIGLLGSGFLLMPELRTQYQALGQQFRATREGDTATAFVPATGTSSHRPDQDAGLAFPDLGEQLEGAWGGMLDAFDGAMDSFDSVLDSFDSSFDSADSGSDGGDSGGDGGGD